MFEMLVRTMMTENEIEEDVRSIPLLRNKQINQEKRKLIPSPVLCRVTGKT